MILGDRTYYKIRNDQTFEGHPEDSWVIHGGVEYTDNKCMYVKEASDYEKL